MRLAVINRKSVGFGVLFANGETTQIVGDVYYNSKTEVPMLRDLCPRISISVIKRRVAVIWYDFPDQT